MPSSLVTVWGAPVIFVQMTVVPTDMVSDAGLKAKVPLLSVVMVTVFVGPLGVGVVGAVVAVGAVVGAVVAVGAGVFALLDPPHAATMKRTPIKSRERMGNW